MDDYRSLLEISKTKLVVIDFSAEWCVAVFLLLTLSVCNYSFLAHTILTLTHSNDSISNTRCGPCKFIGPIFEQLSNDMTDVAFAKVDVDEAEDVAGLCGISAMPTFQLYRDGKKVDELMGADANGLQQKILALK